MPFELPALPLCPRCIGAAHRCTKTMEIHHGKHHQRLYDHKTQCRYSKELACSRSIHRGPSREDLDMSNAALSNNGGGYYNHCLFWEVMSPNGGGTASGALAQAIDAAYGSFEDFKTAFSNAAATQFGSGWAWLCVQQGGKVEVCSSANQDNPLMPGIGCGGTPILGLDVWEHAYYLNYQNRRPDYIDAFFNVINWEKVSELYEQNK